MPLLQPLIFWRAKRAARSALGAGRWLVTLCLATALPGPWLLRADPPGWWADRGIIDPTAVANDYAAVNQGQAKFLAEQAMAEMDAHLPGGAGSAIHALVAAWGVPTATTNDFSAVNLGQLKHLAAPFYDQLIRVGYTRAYPWSAPPAPANDFAAANVGQAKNLFAFDLTTATAANDHDGDGIPDWWEKYYFPTAYAGGGFNVNALAARGDGLTILQAFQQGVNPNDFYNGQVPALSVVQGNGQSAVPGSFVPLPLIVQVADAAGNPVPSAPVTFTTTGGGRLQLTSTASPKTTVPVFTDANGRAKMFFQAPATVNTACQVVATTLAGATPIRVSFTEGSNDGTGAANPAPTDPDDPNDPNDPPTVPMQSYACIDVSGDSTGGNDVFGVALDDDNNVAFSYVNPPWFFGDDGSPDPSIACTVQCWRNGALTGGQVFPMLAYFGGGLAPDVQFYQPGPLTASGTVYCGSEWAWDEQLPDVQFRASGGAYVCTAPAGAGGGAPAPTRPALFDPVDPGYSFHPYYPGTSGRSDDPFWDSGGMWVYVSQHGATAGEIFLFQYQAGGTTYEAVPDADFPYDDDYACSIGYVGQTAFDPHTYTTFAEDGTRVPAVPPIQHRVQQCFLPVAVNDGGCAVGAGRVSQGQTVLFWDGTNLQPIGQGYARALNNQNQVVVQGANDGSNHFGEGFLWESGQQTVLANHLPASLRGQVANILPYCISNQANPGTDATIHILTTATLTQPDGTVVDGATLVCTRDNDGNWSFAQVQPPDGTTINRYVSINSGGAVAGIGSISDVAGSKAANHTAADPTPLPQKALLFALVPMTVKTDFSGSWDRAKTLIGYQQTARAVTSINNANALKIFEGGIWRDIRFKEVIMFNDGSSLWCLSPGWTAAKTSGWLADTGGYHLPGTPDGAGNLYWENPDKPTLPINDPKMLAAVSTITEYVDFRWVLVLRYLGAFPDPTPVAECYTGYVNSAYATSAGGFTWNTSSFSYPLANKVSSAGAYNGDMSTVRPQGTNAPIYSAGALYINKPANWKAHPNKDGVDGIAKTYEGKYPR